MNSKANSPVVSVCVICEPSEYQRVIDILTCQEGFDSKPYGFDPTFQRFSSIYNGKVRRSVSTNRMCC
jgi:hypothetical protein